MELVGNSGSKSCHLIIELLGLKIIQYIMAKKKLCRVELTPEAFVIIEAEAYLSGRTLKSIASEILSSHCSEESKNISNLKSSHVINLKSLTANDTNDHIILEPQVPIAKKPENQKAKGLARKTK